MLYIAQQELNRDRIQAYYKKMGYTFFEDGDFNLNIIAVRNKVPQVNIFNDVITCIWKEMGVWKQQWWPATTDPGLYYLLNPLVPNGTAVLCPGQYLGSHSIGPHRDYTALTQCSELKVWRDDNRNSALDYSKEKVFTDVTGLNIHRGSPLGVTEKVDGYSAGCIVFQDSKNFDFFMSLVLRSSTLWGKIFSLTLIEESSLNRDVPFIG